MKELVVELAAKLQKKFAPTVHVLIAKLLFTMFLAEVQGRLSSPDEINKELHKYGAWIGSRCMAQLAKPEDLEKIHPRNQEPCKVARGMSLYGRLAWYLFAGHLPTLETEIIEAEKGVLIKGVLKPDPEKDYFIKGVVSMKGVNLFYFTSGAYEAAAQMGFKMLNIDNLWWSVWRPLEGEEGLIGFYVWRRVPVEKAVEVIEKNAPWFFKTVSLEDSAKFLREYLGASIPVLRSQ
ncbi:MAG: hypothetical protein DRN04_07525 [Thermoprotei archaeon]|mgnify:CR=1 FL=1|nr:MAG: hypothetical protein DRN04_07525 [Thermoprotei archaeon]